MYGGFLLLVWYSTYMEKQLRHNWRGKTPQERSDRMREAVRARWAKTTLEQRLEVGAKLAEARKKHGLSQ